MDITTPGRRTRRVGAVLGLPWEHALFHIDEAMIWNSVRNLGQMPRSLILVRNLLHQGDVPDAVAECLDAASELLDETIESYLGAFEHQRGTIYAF